MRQVCYPNGMATLSTDFRERILASYDRGEQTRQEIAERFGVSLGMVKKLLQQRRATGDIAPRHHRSGRKSKLSAQHRRRLEQLLSKNADMTLEELRDALDAACSLSAIHRALEKLGLTYKKRLSIQQNKNAPMST